MFGNVSMLDRLKSLDVYKKMPKNYLQPTFMGAVGKNKNKLLNSCFSFCYCYYLHGPFISERIILIC